MNGASLDVSESRDSHALALTLSFPETLPAEDLNELTPWPVVVAPGRGGWGRAMRCAR